MFNHHHKKNEECLNHSVHALGYLTAIIGLVGVAYLGYKKRDAICECWDDVKEKSNHIFTPLVNGAHESKERATIIAKEKKVELKAALISKLEQLNKDLDDLSEEALNSYEKEIKEIRQKLSELKK